MPHHFWKIQYNSHSNFMIHFHFVIMDLTFKLLKNLLARNCKFLSMLSNGLNTTIFYLNFSNFYFFHDQNFSF